VFVTGHTGFKGSWLSLWLRTMGAEVTGYALEPPTDPNLFTQAGVAADLRSIHGDVRDFEALSAALADASPHVVLHMAAQSVVRRGYEDPVETYGTNVMGTVNLLEALRRLGRPCAVVNVTSDKCYEVTDTDAAGFRETDRLGGSDPYSNSKGCAELVTAAFRRSFFWPSATAGHGIALASVRAGNAVGGGDWTAHQLIPDLVRAFAAGRPCTIRSPEAIRPWQFVLEPLRGYLLVAQRLAEDPDAAATAWNFGPVQSDARPVAWIADRLRDLWGSPAAWELDHRPHVPETRFLRLDATKAAQELGWEPAVRLEGALRWIVEWYRGWQAGADLRALTLEQIDRYTTAFSNPDPAGVTR
jgi:CDP-glucose 4,6-dehydratase